MWDITSETADLLFNLSNGILVLGALAVLVGTCGSIKLASVRERFSNDRIAAAQGQARQAQTDLQHLKAPRLLTNDQITRMRARLEPFKGQNFTMTTYWSEKEPSDYTKQIGEQVLIASGWKFTRPEGFLIGVVTGIEVQLSDDSPELAKNAAREFVAALDGEGIPATIRPEPTYKTLIMIQVGMKP